MSGKKKTDVICGRREDARGRDPRRRPDVPPDPGVIERRDYTEEEVVGMVKEALKEARCRGQLVFTRADLDAAMRDGATIKTESKNTGEVARVKIIWPESTGFLLDDEDKSSTAEVGSAPLADEDESSTAEVGSAPLADRETEER